MATGILVCLLAVLSVHVQCAEKVQLGFYSESLCPDCIDFANGPLEKAMNEASACEKQLQTLYVTLIFSRLVTFSP